MVKFNFYLPGGPEALARAQRSQISDYAPQEILHARETNPLQTYLLLKNRLPDCRISDALDPDAINIVLTYDVPRLPPRNRPFVVSILVDFTPRFWVDLQVVHNPTQADHRSIWINNFPQIGLIERDPARGTQVSTVGYFGRPVNHSSRFTRRLAGFAFIAEEVSAICDRLGLKLLAKGEDTWHDYSDVDISLGIRDFSGRKFHTKPPNKLVNSWLAGVPFVGGMDSAFSDVGEADWNYLRVSNAKELERALEKLMKDASLRARLVEKGRKAVTPYTTEELVQRWEWLLMGRATEMFHAFRRGATPAPATA